MCLKSDNVFLIQPGICLGKYYSILKGGKMYNKKTEELEELLKHTQPKDIGRYIAENADEMRSRERSFMNYINELLKEKKLQKQDVLYKADISRGYGYKLLSEEKITRQRDVILRICYAAEFTLEETQQALRLYNMNTLYARDCRDALIMTCFNNRPGGINTVNELLSANNLSELKSSGIVD